MKTGNSSPGTLPNMDTLALLCNLHADGPATLQRLRREGCESLGSLVLLEAAELSLSLDWSEGNSTRFLREAFLLAERLDEPVAWEEVPLCAADAEEDAEEELEAEDEEEGEWIEVGVAAGVVEEDEEEEEAEYEEVEEEEYEPQAELIDAQESAPVKKVLGAWRDLDRNDPPLASGEFPHEAPVEPAELLDYVVEPTQRTPNRPLARVRLAGLNEALVCRLAELGIHSLGGLIEAPATPLSKRLGLPYTRLTRLQFLARRELSTQAADSRGSSASAGPFA
jgi:hypothetical protein